MVFDNLERSVTSSPVDLIVSSEHQFNKMNGTSCLGNGVCELQRCSEIEPVDNLKPFWQCGPWVPQSLDHVGVVLRQHVLNRRSDKHHLGGSPIVVIRPDRCYRDPPKSPPPPKPSNPIETLDQHLDFGSRQTGSLFAGRFAFRVDERHVQLTRIVGVFG